MDSFLHKHTHAFNLQHTVIKTNDGDSIMKVLKFFGVCYLYGIQKHNLQSDWLDAAQFP